jgi:hypothetical protein
MAKMLCALLTRAAALMCLVIPSGTVNALQKNVSGPAVTEGAQELPWSSILRDEGPGGKQATTPSINLYSFSGLNSLGFSLADNQSVPGPARLAPAKLPSGDTMDSRLIDQQFFSAVLSGVETGEIIEGEGVLGAKGAIPEPAALLLLGSGLLILAAFGKKLKAGIFQR